MRSKPFIYFLFQNRLIAVYNISIILFIFIDSFILSPHTEKDLFSNVTYLTTRTSVSHSYQNHVVITTTDKQIEVPPNMNIILNYGDTLLLDRTAILRRNLYLRYSNEQGNYKIPIGLLNDYRWIGLLYAFGFIISINFLFPNPIFKLKPIGFYVVTMILWVVSTLFYFTSY